MSVKNVCIAGIIFPFKCGSSISGCSSSGKETHVDKTFHVYRIHIILLLSSSVDLQVFNKSITYPDPVVALSGMKPLPPSSAGPLSISFFLIFLYPHLEKNLEVLFYIYPPIVSNLETIVIKCIQLISSKLSRITF